MLNRIWISFKIVLSITLVAAPISLLALAPQALADPVFMGISAVLIFFAALPWVKFTVPNRGLALAGIVFSIGVLLLAGQTAFGSVQLPRQCTGRRTLLCEFENLLFAAGGEYLAAAPFAIFAVILFGGSIRMLAHSSRSH